MKKTFLHIAFSCFFICGIYACSTSSKAVDKTTDTVDLPSGLSYQVYKHGSGAKLQNGDIVKLHYIGKLENDTVFDSSRKRGEAFQFKLGAGQVIKGWDEGISKLKVGDRAILTIPAHLAYGNRAMGKIPPNSTLIFDVEILGVKEGVRPFNVEGKDTIKLESGLQIIKLNKLPNAKQPMTNQNVSVHYTGYLENGKIFDSSVERGAPISFPLGTGKVIKGWDEGISKMRVGEKARLIIPSHLAYGAKGYPPIIPEHATLVFDVELVGLAN